MEEGSKSFVDVPLGLAGQDRIVFYDQPSITVLLENDFNCVLESKECVLSCSMVRTKTYLLEMELQCILGQTVGELGDFLEVKLLTVTGRALLHLALITALLLLITLDF